jgi:UDPglucose 6-dehydrogenase
MRIAIFGTGYVGTVTGTCFADLGNQVTCVDVNAERVARLKSGDPVIYEPGLRELLQKNLRAGRIEFTTDAAYAVGRGEVIFICVGTPPKSTGEADLSFVESVGRAVGRYMRGYRVIVTKSTVPVGTHELVRRAIREAQEGPEIPFDVASNPEFLREGSAVRDCQSPDRIVLGVESPRARKVLEALYGPYLRVCPNLMFTTIPTAELIKYASNAMLATRISFMNEISHLCDAVGADIVDVAKGMGLDRRIGPLFLEAGCGYGGSCFPKDVRALAHVLEQHGLTSTLLQAVTYINERQKLSIVHKLRQQLPVLDGRVIAIWGLAFKANTDDIREAPSVAVIEQLLRAYATVRAYDPEAIDNARRQFPDPRRVYFAKDAYEVLEGADALLILTDWDEFRAPDLGRMREVMRSNIVIDGRNIFNPDEMKYFDFAYRSIGRPRVAARVGEVAAGADAPPEEPA